ncbi:MAG: hypothetical protein ACNI3A_03380 [Desulfovibrio sp.]|uniref:hypothetical protein n=1 Tax=Desulfovibrio sp. 7SRBS1 TaxID=3378064 RepID=UPI003B3F2B2C
MWKKAFSKVPGFDWGASTEFSDVVIINTLAKLKNFLDLVHIKYCLLKPYCEVGDYPLVDSRSLLPSFEPELYEYKDLPGLLLVALDRPINSFQEIFQFDRLHNIMEIPDHTEGHSCPLENSVMRQNLDTVRSRLPQKYRDSFVEDFGTKDVNYLENYPALLKYLVDMDRAQVFSTDPNGEFYLSGVFGSLPADLDSEIKRFGLRLGKFTHGDNYRYERNRLFVYQFLMELYGFPIASERRTSAALFSRRLFRMGEQFLVRVLGQSDRTLTTLYATPENKRYPKIEKIALVQVESDQVDAIRKLRKGGYFVDSKKRVIILRVIYKQHKFNPGNVRQARALSVESQEIIHPITGHARKDINIIKDTYNMVLRLTDIVRGEYSGAIVYKRNEVIENTERHEDRLKFLYAWLSKHQRRIIGYSDEFFAKVIKVLDSYLLSPENIDEFNSIHELYREVWAKYSYIQQARKVKVLEDLRQRQFKGEDLNYLGQLELTVEMLNDLKFEIVNYFDELVESILVIGEEILNDSYLRRTYIQPHEDHLTQYGLRIRKLYGRIVALLDEFEAIRKSRQESPDAAMAV